MNPYARAREVYYSEPCARSFEIDLHLHLLHGFVFSTPEFFIMSRPVNRLGKPQNIADPAFDYPERECDCWHIYLAAGDTHKMWSILPWELPWMSIERKNSLRFYPMDRIKLLCPPSKR